MASIDQSAARDPDNGYKPPIAYLLRGGSSLCTTYAPELDRIADADSYNEAKWNAQDLRFEGCEQVFELANPQLPTPEIDANIVDARSSLFGCESGPMGWQCAPHSAAAPLTPPAPDPWSPEQGSAMELDIDDSYVETLDQMFDESDEDAVMQSPGAAFSSLYGPDELNRDTSLNSSAASSPSLSTHLGSPEQRETYNDLPRTAASPVCLSPPHSELHCDTPYLSPSSPPAPLEPSPAYIHSPSSPQWYENIDPFFTLGSQTSSPQLPSVDLELPPRPIAEWTEMLPSSLQKFWGNIGSLPKLYSTLASTGDMKELVSEKLVIPPECECLTMISDREINQGMLRARFSTRDATVSDECFTAETMRDAIVTVLSAATTAHPRTHKSALDIRTEFSCSNRKARHRNGIPSQNEVPASSMVSPELEDLCAQWECQAKFGTFFKLSDVTSDAINLEELCEAVTKLMSRPPRRFNYYRAPVIDCPTTCSLYVPADQPLDFPTSSAVFRHNFCTVPPDFGHPADAASCVVSEESSGLYNPTYGKGKSHTKLGWCDNCPEGGYHRMKTSAYLYHKNFVHGILANGNIMEDPLVIRRIPRRPDRYEGLCGICYQYIELDHKREGKWSTWYRHYLRCSTEYEELKMAVTRTRAGIAFVELEYCPYVNSSLKL